MKRENGFTLIELLAVIVVLAIIALIAVPKVTQLIKNSEKGATERSADNYIEQLNTTLMQYRMNNNKVFPNGTYNIDEDGNLVGNGKTLKVEMNGEKPSGGSIVVLKGEVNKENATMIIGDYTVSYSTIKQSFVANEDGIEILCRAATSLSSQFVYQQGNLQTGVLASAGDSYAYGTEYLCNVGDGEDKTFYVLENSDDTVSLIMNMNIDSSGKGTTSASGVAWCTEEDYILGGGTDDEWQNEDGMPGNTNNGPVTALTYLKNSTKNWTKLKEDQISMPTYDQIYKAAGNKDSNLPTWLYENLFLNNEPYYWTSTSMSHASAKNVGADGRCDNNIIYQTDSGIRPVITISKTQLG